MYVFFLFVSSVRGCRFIVQQKFQARNSVTMQTVQVYNYHARSEDNKGSPLICVEVSLSFIKMPLCVCIKEFLLIVTGSGKITLYGIVQEEGWGFFVTATITCSQHWRLGALNVCVQEKVRGNYKFVSLVKRK